jgi:hypothetical protein
MIIIAPFAKKLRFDVTTPHPKNYPWWPELLDKMSKQVDEHVVQVGVEGEEQLAKDFRKNLSLVELAGLVDASSTWISIDSFFQHFAWDRNKKGIVLFGPSDPIIFGHPENNNLQRDRRYLRERQFWWWEQEEFCEHGFVGPNTVLTNLLDVLSSIKGNSD